VNERDLFIAALQKSVGDRSAFLGQACAGDPGLRCRVEVLLKANELAGGLLDLEPEPSEIADHDDRTSPAPGTTDASSGTVDLAADDFAVARSSAAGPRPITERPGTWIGPYKLIQEIGEGGMGKVYMAEQEKPMRRRVALKIIKPGIDTEQVVARFEAERQALALMDHPSIAKVLDAGSTDSGRPYFVMEMVKGVPITEYCDAARLSARERLEIFVPVCQAIQHAHQKGIIHRDIKPSNVMVTLIDGKPLPKIIDFGVAKAINQRLTEKTVFTQFGSIVGTLEYMSPEQANLSALDVDTRSDIYALGVMLYELLTGTTPLERVRLREEAYSEVIKRIKEEEPPRPSTRLSDSGERLASIAAQRATEPAQLMRLVRGELDWIVMKALEKDRSRRYETASGFARDIQRFLEGDPVEACPPSAAYRLHKFARKHQGAFITAGSFAVMLLAMSAVSTWQAIRATRAERRAMDQASRALAAEAQARSERDHALKAETQARAEADNAQRSATESKAVRTFLENDLLAAARPAGQEGGLGPNATIRQAVDAARPRISQAFKDQPVIEAALRSTLGTTYYYLGDSASAIQELERAVALRHDQLGSEHPVTLQSRNDLAAAYLEAGRIAEAIALFEANLKLREAKLGPDHPDTLEARNNLAEAYHSGGRTAEALVLTQETLKRMTAKLGPDDPATLTLRNNLAGAYRVAGRTSEAIALHAETLKLREAKLGPAHPETLRSRNNLAEAYRAARRISEAIALHEDTLKLSTSRLGPDHPFTLSSRGNLALAYEAAGRSAQAIALHEETLKLREAKLGPNHPDTLSNRGNLAAAYGAVGRTAEAIALGEDTLRRRTLTLGPDHPDTLTSRNNLARTYRDAGRPAEAIAMWEAMLPAARKTFGPAHPKTLITTTLLCGAYESLGRWAPAEILRRELIALRRKSAPPESSTLAGDLAGLGLNLLKQQKWAQAETALRECVKLREADQPAGWATFNTRSLLGDSLVAQQKYAEAEPLIIGGYEGMRAREAKIPAPDRARLTEAVQRAVKLYEELGKPKQAAEWRKRLGITPEIPADPFAR
jgi:serine/threonine protein kinase/tetratricopeptide (TPR) repeat protein